MVTNPEQSRGPSRSATRRAIGSGSLAPTVGAEVIVIAICSVRTTFCTLGRIAPPHADVDEDEKPGIAVATARVRSPVCATEVETKATHRRRTLDFMGIAA